MIKPSDESLVSQVIRLKDTAAFGELVRRHQSRILLLQRRLCADMSLAEDLTQETFLRAWQKLGTYQGSGSLGGWLAAIAYNVFRQNHRQRRKQRLEVPLKDAEFAAIEQDQAGLADLDRLLAVLDREDQVIFILSYAWGLTNTETGKVLGMPPGTVKARIHRAKRSIQDFIRSPQTGERQVIGNDERPGCSIGTIVQSTGTDRP